MANVRKYLKAAEKGNVNAQYNLAICFDYGLSVDQDHAQACIGGAKLKPKSASRMRVRNKARGEITKKATRMDCFFCII